MLLGILFLVLVVILGAAEWYVYDQAMYWHSEEERDPRNFTPPR